MGTLYRLTGHSRQSPKGWGKEEDIIVSRSEYWTVEVQVKDETHTLLKHLNNKGMLSVY